MIQDEIATARRVLPVLRDIGEATTGIAYIGTTKTTKPLDHEAWLCRVRTTDGHEIEFWMEGGVPHRVTEFIEGDTLVFDDSNHINILAELPVGVLNNLTGAITEALSHVLTT